MTRTPHLRGRVASVFERFAAGNAHELHPEDHAEAQLFWDVLGELEETQDLASARPRRHWWSAAAVGGIAAALALLFLAFAAPGLLRLDGSSTYSTAIAEIRTLELSDGSTIDLGGDSEVAAAFDETSRHIELRRGEALFKVAHDKARPFVVDTPQGSVVAVGTQFTVRLNEKDAVVTVVEGIVQVQPSAGTKGSNSLMRLARAGDRIRFGSATGGAAIGFVGDPEHAEPAEATAWRQGHLYFRGETLGEAIAVSNRYSSEPFVLKDQRLAAFPVFAVIKAGDDTGLRDLVAALQADQANIAAP